MNDGSTAFSLGNTYFDSGDFSGALPHFTSAIEAAPTATHFLRRALCFVKLGRAREALADANSAKIAAEKSGDKALLGRAHARKAMALRDLGNLDAAKNNLAEARRLGCRDEVSGIEEPSVIAPAAQPSEAPVAASVPAPQKQQETIQGTSAAAAITPAAAFLPPSKIRHEWFQNENFVTVSIFVKGLPRNDPNVVDIVYTETALSVTIKLPSGSDYMLELDPLCESIIPADCKHSVMSTKVEIKLKKQMMGIKWADLEKPAVASVQQTVSTVASGAPAYPTSSKKKHDWDSIVKNHEDDKPEGEAALHALFKNIYKDASDETRRLWSRVIKKVEARL
ncbi:CS-domain-containing protein [Rhizoclosmatium globosum]|uniref:CS-domain-containing protein n=1 Tax=Rhizoclosmatium globosum TaxID=329046 RepID=A0A1Y2C2L2_9FUNG|nr:CS-domain-containing protein [Rhizoclosmatium globosum]|eukprot:ORY41196.1 CS-domain-containing protein [Rhizoclosmatium globosum]